MRRAGSISDVWNATYEGGPRNGVRTALEDFLVEHDRPVRTVILPVYFGLAVVAEEERLTRSPQLRSFFDQLQGVELQRELTALADNLWLDCLERQQGAISTVKKSSRVVADAYLDLLKGSLLISDRAAITARR